MVGCIYATCAAAILAIVGYWLLVGRKRRRSVIPDGDINGKLAVLVTGCSSGIGRGVARVLAAKGFVVFATVRKEEDARSLSEEFNQKKLSGSRGALVPIWPVDLTSTESIDAMAENVKAKLLEYPGVKLYGIIHNAGGSWLGPSEFLPGEIMRRELEVRIMSPMRINKLLMSELRQSEGRILWMVAAGMMTLPFITAIHASLFAVDCLSMTYDIELQPWGIRSIRIGCGTIETGASDKVYNDLRNLVESNSAVKTLYGGVMDKLLQTLSGIDTGRTPSEVVGNTVVEALTETNPRDCYRVGKMSTIMHLFDYMPFWLIKPMLSRNYGIIPHKH